MEKYSINFQQYYLLQESKSLYYKSIDEFLRYIDSLKNRTWVFLDTETTGLGGPKKEQLTQIGAIATDGDLNEIDRFEQMIHLNDETLMDLNLKGTKSKKYNALKLNYYLDKAKEEVTDDAYDEEESLKQFFSWLYKQKDPMFIIQNAKFDLGMLGGRSEQSNLKHKTLDLKSIAELYVIPALEVASDNNTEIRDKLNKDLGISSRTGMYSSSQSDLCKLFGINAEGAHDAIVDIQNMIKLFKKYIEVLERYRDLDIIKHQAKRIKKIRSLR